MIPRSAWELVCPPSPHLSCVPTSGYFSIRDAVGCNPLTASLQRPRGVDRRPRVPPLAPAGRSRLPGHPRLGPRVGWPPASPFLGGWNQRPHWGGWACSVPLGCPGLQPLLVTERGVTRACAHVHTGARTFLPATACASCKATESTHGLPTSSPSPLLLGQLPPHGRQPGSQHPAPSSQHPATPPPSPSAPAGGQGVTSAPGKPPPSRCSSRPLSQTQSPCRGPPARVLLPWLVSLSFLRSPDLLSRLGSVVHVMAHCPAGKACRSAAPRPRTVELGPPPGLLCAVSSPPPPPHATPIRPLAITLFTLLLSLSRSPFLEARRHGRDRMWPFTPTFLAFEPSSVASLSPRPLPPA